MDPLADLTTDELDEIADTFYGLCNSIAYTAGPTKYAPQDTWTEELRAQWQRNQLLAERFSALADQRDPGLH